MANSFAAAFQGKKMRRFNSHKTVVVCSLELQIFGVNSNDLLKNQHPTHHPYDSIIYIYYTRIYPLLVKYFAQGNRWICCEVMPASIQGYDRNYKCAKFWSTHGLSMGSKPKKGKLTSTDHRLACRYYSSTRVAQAEENRNIP